MRISYIIWQIIKMVLHTMLTLYVTELLLQALAKPIPTAAYVGGMVLLILIGVTLVVNLLVIASKIKKQIDL